VFLVLFALFVFYVPNYLGHPDNYTPANPLVTPAHIVPEWYFLPFYAILRAVPDKLGGVMLMFGSIALLAALPWLDRHPVRSGRYRPLFKKFFWLFVVNALVLGWAGGKPAEGHYLLIGRLCTAYYFFHMLVLLPLLSKYEKPSPLPTSIAAAS
jgi:ubiquinol-cytochrome c reductase cytochrome b subunit